MVSRNPWMAGNDPGPCTIQLTQPGQEKQPCEEVLNFPDVPPQGLEYCGCSTGKRRGICAWLSLIHNKQAQREEWVCFPPQIQLSEAPGMCVGTGERWKDQTAGMGQPGNTALRILDYFRPNLCPVSYCTHLGWMIFLANVSARNYFQIHCGQLQI